MEGQTDGRTDRGKTMLELEIFVLTWQVWMPFIVSFMYTELSHWEPHEALQLLWSQPFWCRWHIPGLDINVCLIPVKTDVGQVDLVSRLSDGTSEKMTVLPFIGYFLW